MPFKSKEQEIWMLLNRPKVYHKWKKKYGSLRLTNSGRLSKRKRPLRKKKRR